MTYLSSPSTGLEPEDLEDRLQELEFLQRLDKELHDVLDLKHVLDITLDWAMRRTAADTGLIARCADDGLHVMRVIGYAYQFAAKLMREPLPVDAGVLGRVVDAGKSVYMAYVTNSADHYLIYEKTRSHFTVPLAVRGKVLGVLHLESQHPAHFNLKMRTFIEHVAGRAAVALRNAELYSHTHNSEQLKSDIIRMAAHDLRNPLNAIGNATILLRRLRAQIPEPAFKFVQSIEQAAHQMRSLIEELLTLERLESGLQIEPQPVNLVEVCHDAISRTKADSEAKAQEFLMRVPDKPLVVRGEFAYFRQVMVNLIHNAVKYTPHRGKVSVRLEKHGDRAFFDVTDSGYGISEERQKQLFQRFYRAKEPGTEHIEGTGLGLSLVKTIVERSEGEVWFRSAPGKGSTFGFWLPLADEEMLAAAEAVSRQAEEEAVFRNIPVKDEPETDTEYETKKPSPLVEDGLDSVD